ncbi:MAG TPA: YhdP family protein [Steroidobacter sp.]
MHQALRKTLKWLLGLALAMGLVVALALVAFGYVVGRVPEYRVQVQQWLSGRTGLAIEFRTLGARLRLYGPELVFRDALVRTPDRTQVLATARRGSVGFDLWNSIATGRLTTGRFTLEYPRIELIRTREGRIQLLGQSALPERDVKPFALEQLPTGRFRVDAAVIGFRDEATGRGPWSLSGVSFELTRSPDSMRLEGEASLPEALGRSLEFEATVEGELEHSEALVLRFQVEGQALDLAGWADVLPDSWPAPESGEGTLRVAGTFEGAELTALSADLDFSSVTAAVPAWTIPLPGPAPMEQPGQDDAPDDAEASSAEEPEPLPAPPAREEMLSYSRIALAMRAAKKDDTWNVKVRDLDLTTQQASWQAAELEASWSRDSRGLRAAHGHADRIVLESVWPLLAFAPESEALARVRALAASGTVHDLAFDYRRASPEAPPDYSLAARLENVAFEPVERAPGLGGLGGRIEMTQAGGRWELVAFEASFELPRLFREALDADSVRGTVEWQREGAGWLIRSEELVASGEDGRGRARFTLRIPGDGSSPVLQLLATGENLKVSSTPKYLPAGRLTPRSLEWFDRAFQGGLLTQAQVIYDGPTRSFPFRNGGGTFEARGHVVDALLDYQPGWLPAREVVADLEFRNEAMRIQATKARVGELEISKASARIPDLKDGQLTIEAAGRGDLSAALAFLKSSPLAPALGEPFARLSGGGPIETDVSLYLPIKELADKRIEVTTRFADASVSMRDLDAPLEHLAGSLTVRNTLLAAADLKGQWLGGPVEVKAEADGEAASVLQARGHAEASKLQAALELPASVGLSGATDWTMTTRLLRDLPGVAAEDRERQVVRVESDLKGLAVGLPHPLGKAAEASRPLKLELEIEDDDAMLARGSLGEVRSLVRVRRSGDQWMLDRGGLRADGVAPALPNHRGLRLEGSLDRFVLDDWLALRGEGQGGTGRRLSELLYGANMRIGSFEFGGYRWSDVRGVLQSTQAGWRVDVNGPDAVGQIIVPEDLTGTQPLRATLERLVLEKATEKGQENDEREDSTDPRKLPALEAHVTELMLGARRIGTVDIEARRVPQGIRFDSITVRGEAAKAEAQGEWLATESGPRSSLKATITSEDVAATLKALNYSEFISAKRGELRGDITWPGGFEDNILEHASGTLSVYAQSGQLLSVQPGAGRVLGLFSVAALPRRLALDFSDLTDKGLAFDTIHGDFELRDGNAYTDNLLLRGPAAEIGIAGRTGFGRRDYDQTAVVTGNLGASLPVAGALAGGPAIGAALLLFSQVFKEPLKGMTRGYYRITGPWEEPNIERVDASSVGQAGAQSGSG